MNQVRNKLPTVPSLVEPRLCKRIAVQGSAGVATPLAGGWKSSVDWAATRAMTSDRVPLSAREVVLALGEAAKSSEGEQAEVGGGGAGGRTVNTPVKVVMLVWSSVHQTKTPYWYGVSSQHHPSIVR